MPFMDLVTLYHILGGILMSEEQKSNFDQENLNESSNRSSETSSRFRMHWNNKFGEDENLKNRQY